MQIILVLHNLMRWAVLLFGLWTLLNGITGVFGKRNYTGTDNKVSLFFMISCDIQLLLGLILYFNGAWFTMVKTNMKEVMKNSAERFFSVEHILMMVIAWILVHIGRASVKKAHAYDVKHKRMLIFFGLAIILILASIPWPFRDAVARPWFRAFN